MEVTFRGIGWIYGYEIKSGFSTIASGEDHISISSQYFSNIQKARTWIEELTKEVLEIHQNQQEMAAKFTEALAGEEILP